VRRLGVDHAANLHGKLFLDRQRAGQQCRSASTMQSLMRWSGRQAISTWSFRAFPRSAGQLARAVHGAPSRPIPACAGMTNGMTENQILI
jgi:hypothetical protein